MDGKIMMMKAKLLFVVQCLRRVCFWVILLLTICLLLNVVFVPFSVGVVGGEESGLLVPLVVDVSYAVAGVEFAFEYSGGLEFVSFEKSVVVSSALSSPVVVRDGFTYAGFYNVDNRYVPVDGKLDLGYLVFNRLSNDSQSVILREIKIVQVVDRDVTRSEFLAQVEIKIPTESTVNNITNGGSSGGGGSLSGSKNSSGDSSGNGNGGSGNGDGLLIDDGAGSLISGGVGDGLLVDGLDSSVGGSNFWLSFGFGFVLGFLVVGGCIVVFIMLHKRANSRLLNNDQE